MDVRDKNIKEAGQNQKGRVLRGTFGSAVIHHRTRCPHRHEARLGMAATAIQCVEGKPESDNRTEARSLVVNRPSYCKVRGFIGIRYENV